MARIWAGYRYILFTFLLLNPAFVLILSAQNIETGGLVGGAQKSNIYTLIISLFTTFLIALVLWFDLIKKLSVISEVRWELIWVATLTLFDIIGVASIASNRPAPDTCTRQDSDWNICSATGGLIALLILAVAALAIHGFTLIVVVVRQSGKTELDVWAFMARELPYALKFGSPTRPLPSDFAPGITGSREDMVEIDLGPPNAPSVPAAPQSLTERDLPPPPPVAYGGRRDPFTFSSVSSLLNPSPRQDQGGDARRFQLYDAPITPVPVARPPVQRGFERVPVSVVGAPASVSAYYAPTPLYEKFARGGRDAPVESPSTYSRPSPSPPSPPYTPPRRREGDFVPWHAREEEELGIRRAKTQRETKPGSPARDPTDSQTLPSRAPPRVLPGTLPNPNAYRPDKE